MLKQKFNIKNEDFETIRGLKAHKNNNKFLQNLSLKLLDKRILTLHPKINMVTLSSSFTVCSCTAVSPSVFPFNFLQN